MPKSKKKKAAKKPAAAPFCTLTIDQVDEFNMVIGQARRRCLLARYVLETKNLADDGSTLTGDDLLELQQGSEEALAAVGEDLTRLHALINDAWKSGRRDGPANGSSKAL